jgi:hypothetical protein
MSPFNSPSQLKQKGGLPGLECWPWSASCMASGGEGGGGDLYCEGPRRSCLAASYSHFQLLVYIDCETTIITQITHGMLGQYSRVPVLSFWFTSPLTLSCRLNV